MKLLALDSTTTICSVALLIDKNHYQYQNDKPQNSGTLVTLCQQAFSEAAIKVNDLKVNDLKVSDLDGIVYTKGPGSFTGVRMTIACAQGLALAGGVPTLGVSTLAMLAYDAHKRLKHNKIAVFQDARMDEIYWHTFDFDNKQTQLEQEKLSPVNGIPFLGSDFIGVGSAWPIYAESLSKKTGITQYHFFDNHAKTLIDWVSDQNQLPCFSDDINDIKPNYLRHKIAKKTLK